MRLPAALLVCALPAADPPPVLRDLRPDPVAAFAAAHPREFQERVQWEMGREVVLAARRHDVPADVLLRTGWRESRLRPGLVSATGDYGVLQVNARYTPEIVRMGPIERIDTGARIMRRAFERCGSWDGAEKMYRKGRCL